MFHDPQSRARHDDSARDDSATDSEPTQPDGPRTADDSVDHDGAAERLLPERPDPYQPL